MSKVLFFDIDGTLVDLAEEMAPSTRTALLKAKENGHKIIVNSGRAYYQILPWLTDISDGIIASSGAYVTAESKLIFEQHMPMETIKRVFNALSDAGAVINGQADSRMIMTSEAYSKTFESVKRLGKKESDMEKYFSTTLITDNIEDYSPVKKILFFNSKKDVFKLQEELGDICDVVPASFGKEVYDSGEISTRGINKSLGIKLIMEYFGLPNEASVAFGDSPNDIDMLEYAHIGVAMGNAYQSVKEIADMVTDDVNSDGISNALIKLGII